jgi:hypothetical protein
MSDPDVFQRAFERWRTRGVRLLEPASEAQLTAAFAAVDYPLSEDVRKLYSLTAGFEDDYYDDAFLSLWSLSRIVEEKKERKPPFLWFADWMIDSHLYCLRYMNPEVSAVYIDHCDGENPPSQIAESVADFLEKYLRNPDDVEAFT